jgi:hypothetical protein
MMHPRTEWILRDARMMFESWKPSYLFLATPQGFFFDQAKVIVENGGVISPFRHSQISQELQDKYLALLNECIVPLGE